MPDEISIGGVCRLADRGVIRASGADAATFLQGQLTNDVAGLAAGQARLAGFCSAKGRLQASFIVWRPADDEFLLSCPTSVLAPTLKRLSMFVLRAKCKLSDASGEIALFGVAGPTATAMLGDAGVWQRRPYAGAWAIRLPDAADELEVDHLGNEAVDRRRFDRDDAALDLEPAPARQSHRRRRADVDLGRDGCSEEGTLQTGDVRQADRRRVGVLASLPDRGIAQ